MNGSTKPGCEQNSFPANGPGIAIIGPALNFGQNKSENKKYSKETEDLNSNGFKKVDGKFLHNDLKE